ncbi:putative Transmembrane protein [Quillaja saponaria]|uniref:Transmembrane protein n=1 Tax=Quillaja saponaria TaxID=32244 RepID=A0AAD7PZG2_QUISA|nr:putative Transmembrane protein [Quillaja saponaria]
MEQKAFFRLLLVVTFIGLSCIFFAASVPATRSQLISNMEDPPAVQHQPSHQDAVDLKADDDFFELEEGLLKGRMIVELADYPEPGANRGHQPGHQPKTPGKP